MDKLVYNRARMFAVSFFLAKDDSVCPTHAQWIATRTGVRCLPFVWMFRYRRALVSLLSIAGLHVHIHQRHAVSDCLGYGHARLSADARNVDTIYHELSCRGETNRRT